MGAAYFYRLFELSFDEASPLLQPVRATTFRDLGELKQIRGFSSMHGAPTHD